MANHHAPQNYTASKQKPEGYSPTMSAECTRETMNVMGCRLSQLGVRGDRTHIGSVSQPTCGACVLFWDTMTLSLRMSCEGPVMSGSAVLVSTHPAFCIECGTLLPIVGTQDTVVCPRCFATRPVSGGCWRFLLCPGGGHAVMTVFQRSLFPFSATRTHSRRQKIFLSVSVSVTGPLGLWYSVQ